MASASMCSRNGHRMNSSARIAAAPINTALFHIGNNPSNTPENMKLGRVARNLSDLSAGCCCVSVVAGNEATSVVDGATGSAGVILLESALDAASGDALFFWGNGTLGECG